MLFGDDEYPKHGTRAVCYWDSKRVRWLPVVPPKPTLSVAEEQQIEVERNEQDSPDS